LGSSGHKDRDVNGAILEFINKCGLGIMAHFTDIIENSRYRLHFTDRRRAMKAIEHYIHFAGKNVVYSLTQVRATLQSAFETNAFVNEAFSAWVELLTSLDAQNLGDLIEHTFCIIAQKWDFFDVDTQKKAKGVLESMWGDHKYEIQARIAFFPDLCGIDIFERMRDAIAEEKTEIEYHVMIDAFVQRCKSDHIVIVRSALKELMTYLEEHQDIIHDSLCGPQPMPEITQLYRSLFDAMVRFKDQDEEMVNQCAQCIGVLGCVDPNQVEFIRAKHGLLVLTNLDTEPEFVDFIAHLLEQVLVVSFRSAPNGRQQSYFAFFIQELLKISGIRDAVNQRARNTPALARWYYIPESVQTALIPYMNTKYSLTNGSRPADLVPWSNSPKPPDHANWLKSLVFNLLHRAKGRNASKIFTLISRVVFSHDLTVATYMLPFVVQNVVTGVDDFELDFLVHELSSILYRDLDGLSDEDVENVKLCSEVSILILSFDTTDHLERLSSARLPFSMAARKKGGNSSIYGESI
jgi:serine/threonine-protein kinase ATR